MKKNEHQSLTANKQKFMTQKEKNGKRNRLFKLIKTHSGGNIIIILLPIYSFKKIQNVPRAESADSNGQDHRIIFRVCCCWLLILRKHNNFYDAAGFSSL